MKDMTGKKFGLLNLINSNETTNMKHKKEIIITIDNAQITSVKGQPDDYIVKIHDYDIPDDWDDAKIDKNGDKYQEMCFVNYLLKGLKQDV